MDTKAIIHNILVAVITAGVLSGGAYVAGVFEKGSDADTKEMIRDVLEETMVTDSGDTYGAALSQMGLDINTANTKIDTAIKEIDKLEDAVLTLASD